MMQPYEQLEAEYQGVACASGTAALHLALEAFEFKHGSQVLVPEFTMIACARAVTMAGLTPVFVDCDDNLLMDRKAAELALTPATVAVMPVHIYGRRCDLGDFAKEQGLYVIEDCAEFHGAPLDGSADAYCWSFYKNKIVAGEEGGMIRFRYSSHAAIARSLRSQGFTEDHDFMHWPRGVNARMSNAHANLILASQAKLSANLPRRQEIAKIYEATLPAEWRMPEREVVWVYDIRIPELNVDPVVRALNAEGIAARHAFKPMSMQPEYIGHYETLNAYLMSFEVMYLPVYPDMSDEDAKHIAERLVSIVKSL
jgi:perosamine synthetase